MRIRFSLKIKMGHVILHLNDKNEIESYEQTFLENAEKRREEKCFTRNNGDRQSFG